MADWAGIRVRRDLYERVAARAAADGVSVAEFAATVLALAVGATVVESPAGVEAALSSDVRDGLPGRSSRRSPSRPAASPPDRPRARRSVKPPPVRPPRVSADSGVSATPPFVRASRERPAHSPTCNCTICAAKKKAGKKS